MTINGNGQTDVNVAAEILKEDVTVGYRPTMPLEALWLSGTDMPQITLRRDIEFMQMHPIVFTALEYYKSGIAGTQFWGGPDPRDHNNPEGKPISPDPRVSMFVLAQAERFWNRGVPLFQEGYPYGWAPGEHIYRELDYNGTSFYAWDYMKGFHPNDGFILTHEQRPVGVRVTSIRESRNSYVDLWLSSDRIPAKAAWYPHRPRFNQLYGRSQLVGAWRPWRRLGWRDCVEQVIDAAIYRGGYKGPLVRYPPGHSAPTAMQGVPATKQDGGQLARRENRDAARQMVEWGKAGAGFGLSSERYTPEQGGGYKWDLEWPEHVMDVRPLIESARYLEDQIMLGIGVPPELVRSGGTGSGYSGRSIPREAFLDGQQKLADSILHNFVDQVLRPLVKWNFGDVPFEICCKSLLQSHMESTQGGAQPGGFLDLKKSDAAKRAWQIRKMNQPGTSSTQTNQPQEVGGQGMSLSQTRMKDRAEMVLDIARTVSRRKWS